MQATCAFCQSTRIGAAGAKDFGETRRGAACQLAVRPFSFPVTLATEFVPAVPPRHTGEAESTIGSSRSGKERAAVAEED